MVLLYLTLLFWLTKKKIVFIFFFNLDINIVYPVWIIYVLVIFKFYPDYTLTIHSGLYSRTLARFDVASGSQLDYESIVTGAGLRRPTRLAHAGRTTEILKAVDSTRGEHSMCHSRRRLRDRYALRETDPVQTDSHAADKSNNPRALFDLTGVRVGRRNDYNMETL